MAYTARVVRIYVSKHPNADRLQLGQVDGAQVVVGEETVDGELGVFFASDGQLSEEFCKQHDLVGVWQSGVKVSGGYFSQNRRVKAQKLRGINSEGFYMPLSCLNYTGYDISKLKEGVEFDELNGHKICNKYYTPATLRAIKNGQKVHVEKRLIDFPEHRDTAQFRHAKLNKGDLVTCSSKMHGTSFRYGNVHVKEPLKPWQKFLNKIIHNLFKNVEYFSYQLGTRRTIMQKKDSSEFNFVGGFYGEGEPYSIVPEKLFGLLKQGEIVYGEIVGYTSGGTPLFTQSTKADKDMAKKYGDRIVYSYANPEGQASFYVYRITQNGVELSNSQMIERCRQLGVKVVPQIKQFIFDGNHAKMNARLAAFVDGDDMIDPSHPREGICIRVESPKTGTKIWKWKSFAFLLLEQAVKESDDYIDAEEVA